MSGMAALARLGEVAPDAEADREAMAPVGDLIADDLMALYDGKPMRFVAVVDPLPILSRRALVTVAVIAVTVGLLAGGSVLVAGMVIGATLGNPALGLIVGGLLGLPVAAAATVIPGTRAALTLLPHTTMRRMAHAIESNALRDLLLVREGVRAGVRDGSISLDTAMDTLAHAAPHTDPRRG